MAFWMDNLPFLLCIIGHKLILPVIFEVYLKIRAPSQALACEEPVAHIDTGRNYFLVYFVVPLLPLFLRTSPYK